MTEWELMLLVDTLTEELEDRLCDEFDAVVGQHRMSARTASETIVSVTATGPSASAASKTIILRLEALGVNVRRLYEDLVSRGMIAERTGVTTQAVGQWIRGDRQGMSFPAPFTYSSGGLWLWYDVNQWLGVIDLADHMRHPDRLDYTEVNQWLLSRCGWELFNVASLRPKIAPARSDAKRSVGSTWIEHPSTSRFRVAPSAGTHG